MLVRFCFTLSETWTLCFPKPRHIYELIKSYCTFVIRNNAKNGEFDITCLNSFSVHTFIKVDHVYRGDNFDIEANVDEVKGIEMELIVKEPYVEKILLESNKWN